MERRSSFLLSNDEESLCWTSWWWWWWGRLDALCRSGANRRPCRRRRRMLPRCPPDPGRRELASASARVSDGAPRRRQTADADAETRSPRRPADRPSGPVQKRRHLLRLLPVRQGGRGEPDLPSVLREGRRDGRLLRPTAVVKSSAVAINFFHDCHLSINVQRQLTTSGCCCCWLLDF